MTTTWTAVFTLAGVRDTRTEVNESLNGLIGAELHRRLREGLAERGWKFEDAYPEDFGWFGSAVFFDEGKPVTASLATSPELHAAADGSAAQDRWRIVIELDLGVRSQTRSRRTEHLRRLARDVSAVCENQGATDIVWQVGDP